MNISFIYFFAGIVGKLEWRENYISFMDTMLQFSILGQSLRELFLPTRLQKAIINPLKQKAVVAALSEGEGMKILSKSNSKYFTTSLNIPCIK